MKGFVMSFHVSILVHLGGGPYFSEFVCAARSLSKDFKVVVGQTLTDKLLTQELENGLCEPLFPQIRHFIQADTPESLVANFRNHGKILTAQSYILSSCAEVLKNAQEQGITPIPVGIIPEILPEHGILILHPISAAKLARRAIERSI